MDASTFDDKTLGTHWTNHGNLLEDQHLDDKPLGPNNDNLSEGQHHLCEDSCLHDKRIRHGTR